MMSPSAISTNEYKMWAVAGVVRVSEMAPPPGHHYGRFLFAFTFPALEWNFCHCFSSITIESKTARTFSGKQQGGNRRISKINQDMGRKKDPAREDIWRVLESGAHTLKQIADESNHSTRTVLLHLKGLVKSRDVKRMDLRSKGYPKNAPKVFYQIDLFAGPRERVPHLELLVHEDGRYRTEPLLRKGLTPLGRRLIDERAWHDRWTPQYKIKRPWLKAREGR